RIPLFRRCHANNCVRRRIDADRRSNHRWIAREVSAPQLLAEHDDVLRARLIFAIAEESSDDRLYSEQIEPVRADAYTLHPLGVGIVANDFFRAYRDHREPDELCRP